MNMPKEQIEYLKSSVAFVCKDNSDRYRPFGTAFLLSVKEQDHVFFYWVTCKHVVKAYETGKLYLRLNMYMRDSNSRLKYLEVKDQEWYFHPDNAVDIAVFPWIKPHKFSAKVKALDEQQVRLPVKEADMIKEGNDIMTIGLFTEYYGTQRNIPAFRFGKVSLLTSEKIQGKYGNANQCLIECNTWPGSSGSPVYIEINEIVYFYGVLTQYYPHRARGSKKKNGEENTIVLHYGISTITPSKKVEEILYGEAIKDSRKKIIGLEERNDDGSEPFVVSIDSPKE